MKTYKLTQKDIKELNKSTVDQLIKELHKLINNKRSKDHA